MRFPLAAARTLLPVAACLTTPLLAQAAAQPATQPPADTLRFPFHRTEAATPIDSVHGTHAHIDGHFLYAPGVSGDALRLDGYTTAVTLPLADLPPELPHGFTLESWVALNTYPWNWAPILDQQSHHEAGFFFGIDAFGHLALEASINGQWRSAISTATLPLKRWNHVAATYQTHAGHGALTIFLNGAVVAELPVEGELSTSKSDALIGRVREATLPFPEAEIKPPQPVWYALDGLLDELTISSTPHTPANIARDAAALTPPPGEALPWQKMPSGPATPGRFGAYYATLQYEEPWDNLRQLGPDSDVVVRFDHSAARLVFWQGLNFIPAWVTADDHWYTDEFLEVWNHGCPDGGDCEPMSDKQARFSHVEILESSPVRAVVHWRYALVEAVNLKAAWPDPATGQSDWADEYWTVYPDGVALRKQVLHSTHIHDVHEWQETIVLHQPGRSPEDDIRPDAITLATLDGGTKTFTWQPHLPGTFADPLGPADTTVPPGSNIQMVNITSREKPFQIVFPEGVSSDFYNNEKSYFRFLCWNHWPVAQIASSDRPCVTTDRPSHSSLSHLFSKTYAETGSTATKLLLNGLTTEPITSLIPLAKSWLTPPPLHVLTPGLQSDGYDPTERAYLLTATQPVASVHLTLDASPATPLAHAALVLRNWTGPIPALTLAGKPAPWDTRHRAALVPRLDSTDLLLWLEQDSTTPVDITLKAAP